MINGTILALTLNEVEGVRELLTNFKTPIGWKLLVVDGGSTDGTLELCEDLGIDYIVQSKPGVRNAYFSAWERDLGNFVISISPDGNCDLSKIPEIIEKLNAGYDLVIGSRYLGASKSEDDDLITGFGNWFYNKLFKILFGGSISDCMVIYRGFRAALPRELDLFSESTYKPFERILNTRISWEPVMTARSVKHNKRIFEIEAGEPRRIGGERKLQIIRWGLAYLFQFIVEGTTRKNR